VKIKKRRSKEYKAAEEEKTYFFLQFVWDPSICTHGSEFTAILPPLPPLLEKPH